MSGFRHRSRTRLALRQNYAVKPWHPRFALVRGRFTGRRPETLKRRFRRQSLPFLRRSATMMPMTWKQAKSAWWSSAAGWRDWPCSVKLAEEGVAVDLISMVPVKRSHSVCAQGGINSCNDIARQQGYSEWMHFDETDAGRRLPRRPAADPGDVRTGRPRSSTCSTAWACPSTARPRASGRCGCSAAVCSSGRFTPARPRGSSCSTPWTSRTRRYEAEGKVNKFEFWEFLWPVIHDGHCVGVVAQDMRTMEIKQLPRRRRP